MSTANIPTERLDNLAIEAVGTVFESMVQEAVTPQAESCMLENPSGDLFSRLPIDAGFHTIVVNFIGDVSGKVMLTLPKAGSTYFAQKLFDVPSLDWIGENPDEVLRDTMGELGNMLVGLVKGGLTKWFPKLMLQTPKVLASKRLKIDNSALSFRKQYLFKGLETTLLVDFCCEA